MVCGYSSSTLFASETASSFVARPMRRHQQQQNGSLVVHADAVRSSYRVAVIASNLDEMNTFGSLVLKYIGDFRDLKNQIELLYLGTSICVSQCWIQG